MSIETPGVRLSAIAYGSPGGPRVLALHGWLDNAASFEPLAAHLRHCELVALDLPGHGCSSRHAPDHGYDFLDLVSGVYFALLGLGWSRCILLGHSLGAAIAAVLAGTFPERCGGLVLLDGLGPAVDHEDEAPLRLAAALGAYAEWGAKRPSIYPDREGLAAKVRAARGLRDGVGEAFVDRGIERVDGGFRWSVDERLKLPSRLRLTEAHVLAFLRRIACPALLVRALQGIAADPVVARQRVLAIPQLRVVEVPGHHHVHLESPETVAPLVRAFVDQEARP